MTRRRLAALVLVWTLPAAVFVTATALVHARFRIEPAPRLGPDARAEVVRVLRAALVGAGPSTPAAPGLDRALPDRGPVVVTLWKDGAAVARVTGRGDTVAAAVVDAAGGLARSAAVGRLSATDRAAARLEVDVVTARGPLGDGPLFEAVRLPGVSAALAESIVLAPGLDGIGARTPAGEALLLPGDLVRSGALDKSHPVPLVLDLRKGLDRAVTQRLLARAGGTTPAAIADARWFRFRTDTFVERPLAERARGPAPLDRGVPPGPEVTAANLRAAALAGARYLVAHMAPSGRYIYEHDLATGHRTDPDTGLYSLPRHAGVTYFLAQAFRVTHEGWLREPIERAAGHLEALVDAGGCDGTLPDGRRFACVRDRREKIASLGSTALTVVALAEYERATGDRRYRDLAVRLATFLLWMQRPDGSFAHRYDVARRRKDEHAQDLYFSGEAALALARMYVVTRDPRYRDAAEHALDWLVGWYDFFLGGFFYGEEHWTCIAAEAIWPAVDKPAYQDFCDGYGAFLRAQQAQPGDLPDEDDLAGAYNPAAPFAMPSNTPAGSRTEAMISAYELGRHRGRPDERIRRQILATLGYLLRQQVRPDGDFDARGADVDGGIPGSPTDRTVRIDYVQHVCSAMLRGAELIEPTGP